MKLKAEELAELLKRHKKYLCGEKDGKRADLSGADLSWANLRLANLSGADLSVAKNVYFPLACPEEGCFTA